MAKSHDSWRGYLSILGRLRKAHLEEAIALGTFSYSLYLIHGPVLVLVRYFLFSLQLSPAMFAVISYVAGVTISVLVAYLFYLVFERPFMSGFLKARKVKDAVSWQKTKV